MSITWCKLIRVLFLLVLAGYLGGFTFYSAVVIPILEDRLGSAFDAGLITQRVTVTLNQIGMATLAIGWLWIALDRIARTPSRLASLLASSVALALLLILHRQLDDMLEHGVSSGFYARHAVYLWISTFQWVVNIALLVQVSGLSIIPSRESRP